MSGFTITGATVIQNIDILPKSIILESNDPMDWGMGIIVLAVAILPALSIGVCNYLMQNPGPQNR